MSKEFELTRRLKDRSGVWHQMVADLRDPQLGWTACLVHNNLLLWGALEGIPGGEGLACQTGVGWGGGRLIAVGWPIWAAEIGWHNVAQSSATPSQVLDVLAQHWFDPTEVPIGDREKVLSALTNNPNLSIDSLRHLAKTAPGEWERERVERVLEGWKREGGRAAELTGDDAPETTYYPIGVDDDLSDISPESVKALMATNPDAGYDLADNPNLPEWAMLMLAKDQGDSANWDRNYRSHLIYNPNTSAKVLHQIIVSGVPQWDLEAVAFHPNCDLMDLARLSQHESYSVRALASRKLAKRIWSRAKAVESSGVEVEL